MDSGALTFRSSASAAPATAPAVAVERGRPAGIGEAPDHLWDVDRVRYWFTRERVLLLALLAVTAAGYLWDLTSSGYANSFYAAAVQAGTKSWKAFFFGSLDSSNFITVDKPPAALWVMDLSGRIFGFSSASMLVPEVLEGVAAVAFLYAAVKRWFGSGMALVAGALLASTPVAALMFRFNNPDALLVMLLVASGYGMTRALEQASTKWVVFAGTMIGFAFLTKMMQAFLVLPAFAFVYLLAAPTTLRRRIQQTLLGGVSIIVSAGWWVAIVALWPAGSRPMIDGTSDNSILSLIVGYNGLGRIFGSGQGAQAQEGLGTNFSGPPGLLRLFNNLMGSQASWLLPAALIALLGGLIAVRRAPRTDRTRAALLLWGGWLVVSGLVFSLSSGVIHTYYTVALAPASAALVAIGGKVAWDHRSSLLARGAAAMSIAITTWWAVVLLDRTPSWEPWLRPLVIALGASAVIALLAGVLWRAMDRRLLPLAVALSLAAAVVAPTAYAIETIQTPHTTGVPSAGPSTGGFGMGASGFGTGASPPGGSALFDGGGRGSLPATHTGAPSRTAPPSTGGATTAEAPSGSLGAGAPGRGGPATKASSGGHRAGGTGGGPGAVGPGGGSGVGRIGGGPGDVTVSSALKTALADDSSRYRWVAAVHGSQSAASIELATGGLPVMAIGGFSGGGNLTLAQFETYVKAGDIHYYFATASAGGPGGGSSTSAITTWVEARYKAVTIGGQTLYDLTQPKT